MGFLNDRAVAQDQERQKKQMEQQMQQRQVEQLLQLRQAQQASGLGGRLSVEQQVANLPPGDRQAAMQEYMAYGDANSRPQQAAPVETRMPTPLPIAQPQQEVRGGLSGRLLQAQQSLGPGEQIVNEYNDYPR
jgi:hypothetical protein